MLINSRRLVVWCVSMYFTKIALIIIESAVAMTIAFWLSLSSSIEEVILLNSIFVPNEIFGGGISA